MGARGALKWAEGLPLWKAEIRAEIGVGVRCVNNVIPISSVCQ